MNLNDLILFARSVESGGFAPAARRFGVPKSTLSKRVAILEAELGVRLIARNSRNFQLTELGREFHEHARAALIEVDSATEVVRQRLAEPSGTVRMTAAIPVIQFQLAQHLPTLARTYPRLHLDLHANDRFVDVVQEGFDIAVRSHFTALPDSGLVQRVLAREAVEPVASPAYLQESGVPNQPIDLARHSGLMTDSDGAPWQLQDSLGNTVQVRPQPRMVCNESVALVLAASAGLGIVCLPESVCRHHLESGDLVRVLPGWTAGTVTTTALIPQRRGLLPSVRAVLEFLATQLAGPDSRAS